jgi:hypothetical protein
MFPVSRPASGEIRQNDGGQCRGIRILLEHGLWVRLKAEGKRLRPQVLPDLQGKGLCDKEAFLLT